MCEIRILRVSGTVSWTMCFTDKHVTQYILRDNYGFWKWNKNNIHTQQHWLCIECRERKKWFQQSENGLMNNWLLDNRGHWVHPDNGFWKWKQCTHNNTHCGCVACVACEMRIFRVSGNGLMDSCARKIISTARYGFWKRKTKSNTQQNKPAV